MIAVGDVDGDGQREWVVSPFKRYVTVVSNQGEIMGGMSTSFDVDAIDVLERPGQSGLMLVGGDNGLHAYRLEEIKTD